MDPMKLPRIISIALLTLLTACSTMGPAPLAPVSPPAQEQSIPPEVLNPDVRQETIGQTICVAGYTTSIRPSTNYTNGIKAKLIRDKGLAASAANEYELDHHLPLALGGHPRNPRNLVLQPWAGEEGARKKDRLERKLQALVCSGALLLKTARQEIYFNWSAAYEKHIGLVAPNP